jgi:hypothetical protein
MFSKKLHFIYILVSQFGGQERNSEFGGGERETHRETLKKCNQGILAFLLPKKISEDYSFIFK